MLDVGSWMLVGGVHREVLGHTTGEVKSDAADLVMISSLFVGWSRRIVGRWDAGWRFRDRNYGHRRPFDCFYADDFGAGRGFGLGFGGLDRRRANQSHGAAVKFLAGVFGGAVRACLGAGGGAPEVFVAAGPSYE